MDNNVAQDFVSVSGDIQWSDGVQWSWNQSEGILVTKHALTAAIAKIRDDIDYPDRLADAIFDYIEGRYYEKNP